MSAAYAQYAGDGVNRLFAVPFPYLAREHVVVSVNATAQSGVGWINNGMVELSSAPPIGTVVDVRRVTPTGASPVDFEDGSVLTESDLDLLATYSGYLAEESRDYVVGALRLGPDGSYNADARRLSNLASGVNPGDAMTMGQFTAQVNGPLETLRANAAASAVSAATSATNAATSALVVNTVAQASAITTLANDLTGLAYMNANLGTITEAPAAPSSTPQGSIKTVAQYIADVRAVAARISDILIAASTTLAAYDNLATLAGQAAAAKTAAEGSASTASTAATSATGSKDAAATSAQQAAASATSAGNARNDAQTAATAAAASATSIQGAVAASQAYASDAASSASAAEQSAETAQAASGEVLDAGSANALHYPLIGATRTGTVARKTAVGLNYNPATGALAAPKFVGDGADLTNVKATSLANINLGTLT